MSPAIDYNDVLSAAERLRGIAIRTPVISNPELDALAGCQVFVKCESFQRTGSFKFRGAYNAISRLTPEQRKRGVITYSSGNHAQAVALAARLLGAPAVIVMPNDAPQVKVDGTRALGAEIVRFDRHTQSREGVTQPIADARGLTLVPPFDHPWVMAGQGTLMQEWLEQCGPLDAVLIPVGGGGLISGCAVAAKALQPSLRVFGVEPEGADDAKQSLVAGARVTIPPPTTIADGVRTIAPGALTFPIMQTLVEDVLIVSDAEIMRALSVLVLMAKLVSEPTGAVALAALLEGRLPPGCRRVGVLLCGGNVDPAMLARLK